MNEMVSASTTAAAASQPPIDDATQIAAYYDACQRWYQWFYSDRASLGIHYGIWASSATRRSDALQAPYEMAVQWLDPMADEHLLDAGCGIGGASLWMAARTPARFTGITLSAAQLATARRLAQRRGLAGRVTFEQMDFRSTRFSGERFDKAFGIESLCYSYPSPETAFAEIYRLLRNGGRLLMIDGVLLRRPKTKGELQLADAFCEGFQMRGWSTPAEIMQALESTGFQDVQFEDQTARIAPSVDDIHRRHQLFKLLRLVSPLRVVPSGVLQSLTATGSQKRMYEAGLLGYGLFYGEK